MGALTLSAWGQQTVSTNETVGALVPDGDGSGLARTVTISGLADPISSLTVSLNLSGGYNGDLYAYLTGPVGQFAVLLNRVGVTGSSASGFADSGFNVTLSDSGIGNIHDQTAGGGVVGGTFQADGRQIDPQAAGSVLYGTTPTTLASSFAGTSGDGTWALFVADLSGGGQSTLVSWGLTVVTVPEPQTWALLGGGLLLLVAVQTRRPRQT
jgi:subtilisin-like proprotein convertase family protein